jgi:hypothetical protein
MTTLTDFHDAIQTGIAEHFGDNINSALWYEQGGSATGQPLPVLTPAIIIELEAADEGDDAGDERAPLLCHITAYCILGQQTTQLQLQIRDFAAQLFALVRKNKWGLAHDVGFPGGITLGPGKFDPEKTGYDSWFVSWDQTLYLGDDVWDSTGIIPAEILWSWAPKIGTDFETEYQTL